MLLIKMETKTELFIKKAKKLHGDRYDYSKVKYKTKIIIICSKHGEFLQTPDNHLRPANCMQCANEEAHLRNKSNESEFINKAKKIHGDTYDYSLVKYYNARTSVIIICKIHGQFNQLPYNHLNEQDCPICMKEYLANNNPNKMTTQQFIERCRIIHDDQYNYEKVEYKNYKEYVIIICLIHGEFKQTPSTHLRGNGCKPCGIIKRANMDKKSIKEFIEDAIVIHGNLYDYSEVNYINSKTNVVIICKKHGKFEQTPSNHYKFGCQQCGWESISYKKTCTLDHFVEKANKVYDNKYDYTDTKYIDSYTDIIIKCKTHGNFKKKPNKHLQGSGCPKCHQCPSCQLWKTYGKLCSYCQPLSQNKLFQKTKELTVVRFLETNLPNIDFIHNKSVGSECNDKHLFPDIRFDCNYYYLIVEVDEYKHRGANYKCDIQRMYDIIAKLGLPCIFIRYNPDNKKSDKNILLTKIKKYLDIKETEQLWDDYGFFAEYLFY